MARKKSPLASIPLRLNRSVNIGNGSKINISRAGVSMTINIGGGMKMNIGPKGTSVFGGPKGVRFRQKLDGKGESSPLTAMFNPFAMMLNPLASMMTQQQPKK